MIESLNIPNHVGIIMDGNGRWAKERGMIRTMGHKTAVKTLKKLCIHMADVGVNTVMEFMDRLKDRVKKEHITDTDMLKEVIVDELFVIYVEGEILTNKIKFNDIK